MTDNKNIEKSLHDSMNRLAESVNCFDRITERVFPDASESFEDDGISVRNCENITSRSKIPAIIKWSAVAVAVICGIIFIPKTSLIQRVFYDMNNTSKEFDRLLADINAEISDGSYSVTDVPLDEYYANPSGYTPFFTCPFENKIVENIKVRIFVFCIDETETNQVFAVEYKNEYSDDNIIAVADSGVRFSDDDIDKASCFTTDDFSEIDLHDIEKESYKEYGFIRYCSFVKTDSGVLPVTSEIAVSPDNDYDVISVTSGENYEYYGEWAKSLYYNGKNASGSQEQETIID